MNIYMMSNEPMFFPNFYPDSFHPEHLYLTELVITPQEILPKMNFGIRGALLFCMPHKWFS